MPEIACAVVEDLLDLYLDGETSEETTGLIAEHVQRCAKCRSLVRERERARAELVRRAGLGRRGRSAGTGDAFTTPDARLVARARARLRKARLRIVALTLAVAVAAWAAAWFLTTPAPPGLYLARCHSSQVVLTGNPSEGFTIPFLWVPSYPGEALPEMSEVMVMVDRGEPLWLKVYVASTEGGWLGLPRYRRGNIHAFRGQGVFTDLGDGSSTFMAEEGPLPPLWDDEGRPYVTRRAVLIAVLGPTGRTLAETEDVDLSFIQMNVPATGNRYLRVGRGSGLSFRLSKEKSVEVELVDVILPSGFYPLQASAEVYGEYEPLEVPLVLPEHLVVAGPSREDLGPYVCIAPLFLVRVEGEMHYVQQGRFSTLVESARLPLREVYDLGRP
jgi:hypothetical protein